MSEKSPRMLVCPACGTQFLAAHGSQRYCSKLCKHRAGGAKRLTKPPSSPCAVCGVAISQHRFGRTIKYCEAHRVSAQANPGRWVECYCGVTFYTSRSLRRYCSPGCRPTSGPNRGSTTDRGYGAEHQASRRALLPAAVGTECELCGQVMLGTDRLDLDHVVPVSQGGRDGPVRVVHSTCNRVRGQKQSMRAAGPRARQPRACEMCARRYMPSYFEQRTCGRACGALLRKVNAPRRTSKPVRPVRQVWCEECGSEFSTTRPARRFCGDPCSLEARRRAAREAYRNSDRWQGGIYRDDP